MPITPLHFGCLPLLNRVLRPRVSAAAFVLANLATDMAVVLQLYAPAIGALVMPTTPGTLHGNWPHTFAGALLLGSLVGALRFRSGRWWLGSLLGTLTHVALDMLVHHDMAPFAPLSADNPFYRDWAYHSVSLLLLIGLVLWILDALDAHRKKTAA